MSISAKIILDSISKEGKRLTTWELEYPRFIHSEFMTHRQLSRNASSSRAIPVKKMISNIIEDTAMPVHWGKNQSGMQADEENNAPIYIEQFTYDLVTDSYYKEKVGYNREDAWKLARDSAIKFAEAFEEAGYHKQIVNRLVEPFMHIKVIVTGTEWSNFFALRAHPMAQPEFRTLAYKMKELFDKNKPTLLRKDEWHLPYINSSDVDRIEEYDSSTYNENKLEYLIKLSVSRCARVSYLTHDNKIPTIKDDLKLYDRLVGSEPLHASPTEHQATPDMYNTVTYRGVFPRVPKIGWQYPEKHGNFDGWIQYRKTLQGECQ